MVKNIVIGAVEKDKATVIGKVPYTIGGEVNDPKIYTLTYDRTTIRVYINGELVASVPNDGNTKYLDDIFFGSDWDDVNFFRGIIPTVSFYDEALADTEREALESYLADAWLPTGTVLASGHVAQPTEGVRPTWSASLGEPFMIFDHTGLAKDGNNRVTSWTDSTTLGTQRVASPKPGNTNGVRTVKGKDALYFDNNTYFKIPELNTSVNSPNPITISWVCQFDDFDDSFYSGSGQCVIGAANHTALRFKKYNADEGMQIKFQTGQSGADYFDLPRDRIIVSGQASGQAQVETEISLYPAFTDSIKSPMVMADGTTNYGTTKHIFSGLNPDTHYYGRFIIDGVADTDSNFSFKTFADTKKSFKILTGSCNRTASTADTWSQMLTEKADLMVHMGDLHYENVNSTNPHDYANVTDLALSSPQMSNFFRNQPIAYLYDNHDSIGINPNKSDDFSTYLDFYDVAFPHYSFGSNDYQTDGTYFSWNLGRTRCIMTGMRTHRNAIQDVDDVTKTTLGTVQKQWLKDELLAAKAAGESIIWFSCICYVADVDDPLAYSFQSGGMSWGNYATEREELANFIYDNQIKNITIVSGDSHMQALDDGRNAVYCTDINGDRRDFNTIADEYKTPNLAASPLDQYNELEGGGWQISTIEGSGLPLQYEQSYGVIEVTDIGENWIQTKISLKGLTAEGWKTTAEYIYNRPMEGTPGDPPSTTPYLVEPNGYVGRVEEWQRIKDRHIGVSGQWKPVSYKYYGDNGFWRQAFREDEINKDVPFYVDELQGYTLNNGNSVAVYGNRFLDSQFISPQVGAYFDLRANYSDIFGNLLSGSLVGAGGDFNIVEEIPGLTLTANDTYFQVPQDNGGGFNAIAFTGTDGEADNIFSVWVHIPTIAAAKKYIMSYGTTTDSCSVFVDASGQLNFEFVQAGNTQIFTSPEVLTAGWSKIVWSRKGVDNSYTKLFINGAESTIDFSTLIVPAPLDFYEIRIGTGYNGVGVLESSVGFTFANVYVKYKGYASDTQVGILTNKPTIDIVFIEKDNPANERIIGAQWVSRILNTEFNFTIPPIDEIPNGTYNVVLRSIYHESEPMYVKVQSATPYAENYTTDFTNPAEFRENFYLLNKQWGGANGGVVAENASLANGKLTLRAQGDNYTGDIQGVDRDGIKKFHTDPADPQYGEPWTNRVGAAIVFNKKTGFGSYEAEVKIPNNLGVAYAMWTFFYNEIYPNDTRYDDYKAEGLHEQGSPEAGYYITRNHEIDIEFPSHLDGGVYNQPSLSNVKLNTWRGELKTWGLPESDPNYYEEYKDNLTPLGANIADGEYHKLRFDWHYDRVEFYIDDVLMKTQTNTALGDTIPDITGHLTLGLWFPSAALSDKPWLVDPNRAWGGGVIDTDGGMKADFDQIEMEVRKFSYSPYITEQNNYQRTVGETYPFGGYRSFNTGKFYNT